MEKQFCDKFVSDLRWQFSGVFQILRFSPQYNLNIVESGIKHHGVKHFSRIGKLEQKLQKRVHSTHSHKW
jgi:hypothetical protein